MAKRRSSPAHQSENRLLQETDIYLMSLVLYVFFSKCGISDKTSVRRAQVDKGIAGAVKTVTCAQVPFGKAAEGLVHTLYYLFNVSRWFPGAFARASGRTEIFLNANPVIGICFLWACNHYEYTPEIWQVCAVFVSPWVWIEAWVWVQIFRFMGWAFAAALAFGVYWFLENA